MIWEANRKTRGTEHNVPSFLPGELSGLEISERRFGGRWPLGRRRSPPFRGDRREWACGRIWCANHVTADFFPLLGVSARCAGASLHNEEDPAPANTSRPGRSAIVYGRPGSAVMSPSSAAKKYRTSPSGRAPSLGFCRRIFLFLGRKTDTGPSRPGSGDGLPQDAKEGGG